MPESIEIEILSLLRGIREELPKEVWEEIYDLVTHREWGVGLQNLRDQLYEFNVSVEPAKLETIESLAKRMHLPPRSWKFLIEKTDGDDRVKP
jgi:hypothetical protein